ncbi:MAG: TonB-dependent receptor, partial [Melioribacteraceae bacterium]|nr:TonB-dependent receptor [Melioribacteraceae bacterium]
QIDKNWTDAYSYYVGMSYEVSENHRLELYALGAPQRHGQNLYRQNAAVYSHEFAKDELGYSQADLDAVEEQGRLFSQNWGPVSSSYTGKQWWNESESERFDPNFINERENFFHKPIVNFNWYAQFSKAISLYTTAYYSGGHGGGTGTLGSIGWDYSGFSRTPDWDATIERNRNNVDSLGNDLGSRGILRNSRNNQWTIGLISKMYWKLNKTWTASFGIDWRTAEIDHFREVRDLLGGSYYTETSNDFDTTPESQKKVLGDKVAYYNTNTVDWFGAYAQAEYNHKKVTAFATLGWSGIKYSFLDHFSKNDAGGKVESKTDMINGGQIKGGASYRATDKLSFYANLGYVSKVPIFDQAINDRNGAVA